MSEDKIFNETILVGRLVADAEGFTHQDVQAMSFSVAYNEFYVKDGGTKKRTDFFDVVAWSNQCDLEDLKPEDLKKGLLVQIRGKLKTETWHANGDPNDKRSRVKISALAVRRFTKEAGEA